MAKQHHIRFVADDALPVGHDFMLMDCGEAVMILYKESALTAPVLEDSWAAYRALCEAPPPRSRLRCAS